MSIDLPSEANASHASRSGEFELTILSEEFLSQRLLAELRFAGDRLKKRWPELKKHPVKVISAEITLLAKALTRTLSRPQMVLGACASLIIVASLALVIVVLDMRSANRPEPEDGDDFIVTTIPFPLEASEKSDPGIGAGEKGRVGFERGRGEGSRPERARSEGGGGGGTRAQLPASQGRPPAPSLIPAPIPTAAVHLPQALPVAGIDLDPALWRKLDYSQYGDPRSKSTTQSNGQGEGGGVGTGKGLGIGEGEDNGFGPGRKGNIGGGERSIGGDGRGGSRGAQTDPDDRNRIYKSPEVTTRPRVISKPEPQYTESARREQITGTVVLRVVFSSSGEVTNIQAMQKLGGGLTEKAIAAARRIQFVPATRNGHAVSMYMQLEYNFNLY